MLTPELRPVVLELAQLRAKRNSDWADVVELVRERWQELVATRKAHKRFGKHYAMIMDLVTEARKAQDLFVELYRGWDLEKAYERFEHYDDVSSCMTGTNAQNLEALVENPEVVGVLVAYELERPVARALLWHAEARIGREWIPALFLDRIYGGSEAGRARLIQYHLELSSKHGLAPVQRGESMHNVGLVEPWGDYAPGPVDEVRVWLIATPDMRWPYLDTLQYLTFEGKRAILSNASGDYILSQAGGGPLGVVCVECGEFVAVEDAYYPPDDGPYCAPCFREHWAICERCNREVRHEDAYLVQDSVLCERCVDWVAGQCSECGEWYYIENIHHDPDGEPLCYLCAKEEHKCSGCGESYPRVEVAYRYTDDVDGLLCKRCRD